MTDEQAKKILEEAILSSIDRSIESARSLEGKELTRSDVTKAWKKHIDLAENS